MKIIIGDKEFEVSISKSSEESRIGLSNTDKLPKSEGFAMKFNPAANIPITMKGMKFPIDIIFTLKGKVTKVVTALPANGIDIVIGKPSDLIIEVNAGEAAGIKPGNSVEFIGIKNDDGTVEMAEGGITVIGKRQVLDENGKNQMNLKGGERIFSRISTRKIFELAKAKDFKKLGKFVIDEVIKQNERPVEYAAN